MLISDSEYFGRREDTDPDPVYPNWQKKVHMQDVQD